MMRQIEICADSGYVDTLQAIADQNDAVQCVVIDERPGAGDAGKRAVVQMIVPRGQVEPVLDAVQMALGANAGWRLVVQQVEAVLPASDGEDDAEDDPKEPRVRLFGERMSRDEIFNAVTKDVKPTATFVLLAIMSTMVAALGMLTDSLAVVIGAMVIAPLLGPNLAFAFGTAIGDRKLMFRSLQTSGVGLAATFTVSIVIGLTWTGGFDAAQLTERANVTVTQMVLALASGAAAVLSITTGVSSALVGVMVAVALLPPAAAFGIYLGAGNLYLAGGALTLLAVNVAAINLAAQAVFVYTGIRPRTWSEKKVAAQARFTNAATWAALLAILIAVIVWRGAPTLE